jgi:SEC-C motif-containing protein
MKKPNKCPCQSGQAYAKCCGPYHKGKLQAPNAETLMRSRFSAYVLRNAQYLYRTWESNTRPTLQSLREAGEQTYTSLKILSSSGGEECNDTATVEFIASYEHNNQQKQHHENSRFIRVKNRWVYVDAI